jgi:hypothetical protein
MHLTSTLNKGKLCRKESKQKKGKHRTAKHKLQWTEGSIRERMELTKEHLDNLSISLKNISKNRQVFTSLLSTIYKPVHFSSSTRKKTDIHQAKGGEKRRIEV